MRSFLLQAYHYSNMPAVQTLCSFLSFLPSSVKELFAARACCYCVAVIVILLHLPLSCQESFPFFRTFFHLFLLFISFLFSITKGMSIISPRLLLFYCRLRYEIRRTQPRTCAFYRALAHKRHRLKDCPIHGVLDCAKFRPRFYSAFERLR